MKLYDIISNLKFVGIKNYQDLDIDSLSCTSTEQMNDGMFFCIKGTKVDGHKYALESIKNGAVCLVVEEYLDIPITQIRVENCRLAMSQISAIFFEIYSSKMKFVGVTGTNGKTTSCFLIREMLMSMGKKVGMIGTEGIFINSLILPNKLTTPDPINLCKAIKDMENNGCEFCVMEVSAHAIALNKIDGLMFDVVGFSNLTLDHLDFFVNMENYKNCKISLFNNSHAKQAVVNTDDKLGKTIVKTANIDCFSFGKSGQLQLMSSSRDFDGTLTKLGLNNKVWEFKTNLIGDYNISNLMLAISVLLKLDFKPNEIFKTIKRTQFEIPGRFNVLSVPASFHVVVDYAHTPDGMKNVLESIKKLPHKRIITVFGCGGNRDKSKRKVMGEIATSLSSVAVVTSDNPRNENPEKIIDDIVENLNSDKFVRIVNRKQAIDYALNIARTGDVVAILGKGNESYQEIAGVKLKFSDYDVVENYFKAEAKSEIHA